LRKGSARCKARERHRSCATDKWSAAFTPSLCPDRGATPVIQEVTPIGIHAQTVARKSFADNFGTLNLIEKRNFTMARSIMGYVQTRAGARAYIHGYYVPRRLMDGDVYDDAG